MILNEISLKTINTSQTVAKDKISQFLDVCHLLFHQKREKTFYYTKELMNEPLIKGYSIHEWLADPTVSREEKTYLRSLVNRGVLLDDLQFLESQLYVDYRGKKFSSVGCLAAYEWGDLAISLSSDELWMKEYIRGNYITIETDEQEVCIKNCSTKAHVDGLILEQRQEVKVQISSGKEVWDKREELFPHLVFCENVKKQLEEVEISIHIKAIIERIQILEDYFATYEGTFNKEKVGYGCRYESESVQNDAKLRRQRKFKTPYGNEEYFYWHISFPGDYPGRIHFRPDAEHNVGIIGYVGKHLPTKKYAKI